MTRSSCRRNYRFTVEDIQRVLTIALLIGMFVGFSYQFPQFASLNSAFAIIEGFCPLGLITLGLTVTIIAGEIDLSVGSVAAFIGVVILQLVPILGSPVAIVIGVLVGLGIGAIQGALVSRLRIQGIVLTIGSLVLFRGLSLIAAGEKTVPLLNFTASDFIQSRYVIFSPASLLVIAIFIVLGACLKYNKFGREMYAIGGSRREALAAGVPLTRPTVLAFAISGACAGLAGAIIAIRSGSAQPLGLQDLLLSGTTAAFVGGVHINGGRGTAAGAALGALMIQILTNGMNFYFAPAYVVGLVLGVLLTVVVVLQLAGERAGRSRMRRDRLAALDRRVTATEL
jgi:ribose/xylose/arabinose/galactoside ABC-type transport system permease subunit